MALEKRISELTAKSGALEDTDLMVISDYNGETYDTKKVTGAQIKPYKNYLVSISQIGTGIPTVNSSYSELSGTLTFSRIAVGTYLITNSVAEFTNNKTFVQISNGGSGPGIILGAVRQSTTQIGLYSSNSITAQLMDSCLDYSQLEIKIIK